MNRNFDRETVTNGKNMAIVAYITIVGFIVAYIINKDNKNSFTSYHLRQGLGVGLTGIIAPMFAPLGLGLGAVISSLLGLLCLIMLITGIVNAANGQTKPVVALGQFFEEWFEGI